jgi:hypothetical protein
MTVEIEAIAPDRSLGEEDFMHEWMKPLNGIQLVQVQPGQNRSGQAGSACCACIG